MGEAERERERERETETETETEKQKAEWYRERTREGERQREFSRSLIIQASDDTNCFQMSEHFLCCHRPLHQQHSKQSGYTQSHINMSFLLCQLLILEEKRTA